MSEHLELEIEGMTCGSCSKSIITLLSNFDFTENIDVDWESGKGELDIKGDFDENRQKVVNAIQNLGYEVLN